MLMRVLVLYDWLDDFEIAKHPEVLLGFIGDLQFRPNKASFHISGEKFRDRTLFKKTNLADVLRGFDNYVRISLNHINDGNYLDFNGHLSFEPSGSHKRYVTVFPQKLFSVNDALRHLHLVCRSFTPRYGFTHVEEGASAVYMTSGVATTSLSHDGWTRITDLGHSLRETKEHLAGKLHDVYALNVLSPLHLSRPIKGKPLGRWIGSKGCGQLVEIKGEVFAWTVPDTIRAQVRLVLFNEGLLIASV